MNRILDRIAAQRPGYPLEQYFYLDEAVFEADMELLLNRWTYAGHVCEVVAPGDFLVAELGRESAIVVRDAQGTLRALNNVCRHRGSRVCTERRGHVGTFVCPYHAWAYRLDGSLKAARQMPPGFDPKQHGLHPLPLQVVGGLIFVSFGPSPPLLDTAMHAMQAFTQAYGWADALVAERRTYTVASNWKLALENYQECYHCGPAHPEFSQLHALARPPAERPTVNLPKIGNVDTWRDPQPGHEPVRVLPSTLSEGVVTGSRGGRPLAPLMTSAAGYSGGCTFAEVGFLSAFLAYEDHGLIYRFIPRELRRTDMEVIWLVRSGTKAGVDYQLDELTWLWEVTTQADKRIIEANEAGVRSRAYSPAPYSLMETPTALYTARYLQELRLVAEARG
jgi:phenylpropionate dioxygenase-like ring-hydroxylating dioxygenase large terminal subunit